MKYILEILLRSATELTPLTGGPSTQHFKLTVSVTQTKNNKITIVQNAILPYLLVPRKLQQCLLPTKMLGSLRAGHRWDRFPAQGKWPTKSCCIQFLTLHNPVENWMTATRTACGTVSMLPVCWAHELSESTTISPTAQGEGWLLMQNKSHRK